VTGRNVDFRRPRYLGKGKGAGRKCRKKIDDVHASGSGKRGSGHASFSNRRLTIGTAAQSMIITKYISTLQKQREERR
jgi:hypothetical protein